MSAMLLIAIVGLGSPSHAGEAPDHLLDRRQIREVLREAHSPLRDYECLYEGHDLRLQELDLSRLPDPIRKATERSRTFERGSETIYQGSYAYRSDQSFHIDVSVRHPDPVRPVSREILCLFHGEGVRRTIVADEGGPSGPDSRQRGSTIFVKKAYSLLRIDMFPYLWESVLNEGYACEFVGWEVVDGQRCLVIDFPKRDDKGQTRIWGERFWVDLSRNGCVVKYERDDDGSLTSRLIDLKLSKVAGADKTEVWVPVAGKLQLYRDGLRASSSPVSEQTYEVLEGSLKVNQSLPDSRFAIDYNLDQRTRTLARNFNRGRAPSRKGQPNDSESSLRRTIRDIDDPAKRLVATPASERGWLTRHGASLGIVMAGAGVLVVALYLRIRRA